MSALFPGCFINVDVASFDSNRILTNISGGYTLGLANFVNADRVGHVRAWNVRPELQFYDRAVNLSTICASIASSGSILETLRDTILRPNDLGPQIRAILSGQLRTYVGIHRRGGSSRQPDFELHDHALLDAALPAIRAWAHLADLLGMAPLGRAQGAALLDALEHPAWIVAGRTIVHANDAALASFPTTPAWVRTPSRTNPIVRRTMIGAPGGCLELVTLRVVGASGLGLRDPTLIDIPPYLRSVTAGLVRGLADKEIATDAKMPLSTVRTYVTRILRHCGASSRRELIRRSVTDC